jgi:hypothetical protein
METNSHWGWIDTTLIQYKSFRSIGEARSRDVTATIPVYVMHQERLFFPVFRVVLHDAKRVDPNVLKAKINRREERVLKCARQAACGKRCFERT